MIAPMIVALLAASPGNVAVVGLRAVGVPEATADAMTEEVSNAVQLAGGNPSSAARGDGDSAQCETKAACLLARSPSSATVVAGSLGRDGQAVRISLAVARRDQPARVASGSESAESLVKLTPLLKPLFGRLFAELEPKPKAVPGRVVVMDTKGDSELAPALQEALVRALGSHSELQATSSAELRGLLGLEKTKELLGCAEDASCAADISQKMSAETVVTSSVGKVGNTWSLTVTLLKPGAVGASRSETATRPVAAQLVAAAPEVIEKLFGVVSKSERYHFKKSGNKDTSFAVFDLKAAGVSPEVVANLTQIVSVEIKRIDGTSVISRDDLVGLLGWDKEKQKFGCDDTSCMAEIGSALGVKKLVIGSVGKLADSFVVNLVLMDVRKSSVDNRIGETFKGEEDQLIRAVRHATRLLLGVDVNGAGKLAITSSQTGAAVFVDDLLTGNAPLSAEKLTAGRHAVHIVKSGYFDWTGDFYVDPFDTTAVWAKLQERPEKWYQKWWVWGAAGAVVAGGTTALILSTRSTPTTGTGTVTVP